VTLLANLGDLQQGYPHLQATADRHIDQIYAGGGDVFCEVVGIHIQTQRSHLVDALLRQQADMAVPVTRMAVADEPWFSRNSISRPSPVWMRRFPTAGNPQGY